MINQIKSNRMELDTPLKKAFYKHFKNKCLIIKKGYSQEKVGIIQIEETTRSHAVNNYCTFLEDDCRKECQIKLIKSFCVESPYSQEARHKCYNCKYLLGCDRLLFNIPKLMLDFDSLVTEFRILIPIAWNIHTEFFLTQEISTQEVVFSLL